MQKRTVKLYGELGRRFGRVHRLAVNSPAEAIRALVANYPGFETFMRDADKRGLGFRVINGRAELASESDIAEPAAREIKIVPTVIGASAGVRILIGAALIAAAFIPGLQAASPYMISAGISLTLGGVIELLSPPPGANEPPEDPENTPSYVFNGPVNTLAQGHPVPVGYGRLIVGGAVISGGLTIEQIKAGYKRVKVDKTIEGWSQSFKPDGPYWQDAYAGAGAVPVKPPANTYKKTKIGETTTGSGLFIVTWYKYRFTYYEWTLVPA